MRIIKAGLLDTIQDDGRYGYQHLGVNPSGAMDRFSARLANALLGKELQGPVLELHFPAAQILFEEDTVICLTGADFHPVVNNKPIPLHHPVFIPANSLLAFTRHQEGARCYLAVWQQWELKPWLNSYSTNLKAQAGGLHGKCLERYDLIPFQKSSVTWKKAADTQVLPWKANEVVDTRKEIECLIGSEWYQLTPEARESFLEQWFQVTHESDRMGYRLAGKPLEVTRQPPMISAAVSFGTVQLLPNGQLIVLMADHQTTGGYPRLAHVSKAHLPILAQKNAGQVFRFRLVTLEEAEKKIIAQYQYLKQLQLASGARLQEWMAR
jgi:antagonist of KipI